MKNRLQTVPKAGPSANTPPSPARQRLTDELLQRLTELDDAPGDRAVVQAARERLRAKAAAEGIQLTSFAVTSEPMADPEAQAMSRRDRDRFEGISQAMYTRPAELVEKIERLSAKYPRVATLRNHLAGALEAAGEWERSVAVNAQTMRDFPRYIFAFCNHVMMLLVDEKVEEARALVETGPRGPLFMCTQFDPARQVFHVSEVSAYAAMVGHYMLATDRADAAKTYLGMIAQVDADGPAHQRLAWALQLHEMRSILKTAMTRMPKTRARKAGTSPRKSGKAGGKQGTSTREPGEGAGTQGTSTREPGEGGGKQGTSTWNLWEDGTRGGTGGEGGAGE